jgi:glutathione synthase/RimK-type ligase-like ATP-grasp enzyme
MMNRHRLLVDVVTRYCATRGIALDIRAEGWLLLLGQPPRRQLILGYDFGLNNAVAHRVANDKAATSEILALSDVACVPHSYVMAPISGGAGEPAPEPAWAAMFELLQIHPDGLVVKPNEGTSGRSVTHVRDRGALTAAVNAILTGSTDVALSPFLAIEDEVRVVLLDGTALIVYRKLRPTLTGDGVHSLRELARMATAPKLHTPSLAELDAADLDAVLPQGQQRLLSWRHNLEFGARPELLESGDVRDSCVRLAAAAAQAIGIRFASVDVVRADGRWQVLEINSGVMMETLGKSYPEQVDAAYGAALDRLFGDRPNG